MFIIVLFIQIIHNGCIKFKYENTYEDQKTKDLINQVTGKNIISDSNVSVAPAGEDIDIL